MALAFALACKTAPDAGSARQLSDAPTSPATPNVAPAPAPAPVPGATEAAEAGEAQAQGRSDCTRDPRVTPFAPNLRLSGGTSRLEIVSVRPPDAEAFGDSPPQMGLNALQVRITGAHGRPMPGAQVTLRANMPDHAHGGSEVRGTGRGPIQALSGIDLMMPGVWRLDFEVAAPHHPKDTMSVHLCIPG